MKIYPIAKWCVAATLITVITFRSSVLRAQTDTGDDTQFLIESTVGDLASPDAATADKAEKTLIGLGDAALPAIQKIEQQTRNMQCAPRVEKVLTALESKFKIAPTLVTLKLDNVAPEKVFAELSRIGGVRADAQWNFWDQNRQGIPAQISVDFENKPFVQALYETCRKARVRINEGTWSSGYNLEQVWGQAGVFPTFTTGSALFYVESIQRSSGINFGTKEESDDLAIQLHTIVDPKLPIARSYSNAIVSEAIGDTGASLTVENNNPNDSEQWSSAPTFTAAGNIALKFKTGQNKMIKSLKGFARFSIGSQPIQFVFANPAAGQSIKHGDWTVSIAQFSDDNGQGYSTQIQAVTSQPADQSSWNGQPNNGECMIYDEKGMPYIAQGQGGGSGPGQFQMYMRFMPGPQGQKPRNGAEIGKPTKLVVTVMPHLRTIRVPFEFTDLAIPSPSY